MIYLWVKNEGWKTFEITDTAELKKRGIEIGPEGQSWTGG